MAAFYYIIQEEQINIGVWKAVNQSNQNSTHLRVAVGKAIANNRNTKLKMMRMHEQTYMRMGKCIADYLMKRSQ
jgi:hypothetical protein